MPASSKRRAALVALKARLSDITIVNGYNTDAGKLVLWGETPALGPDDAGYALMMVVGPDGVDYVGENVTYVLPVEVQAVSLATVNTSYEAIEAVLEDIKRAVEKPDLRLGGNLLPRGLTRGATRTLPREDGSEFIGVGITYNLSISEGWGNP